MSEKTPAGALLRAESLECGYADATVCGPVDLTLAAGERLAIVGANAAGKSTLLRTLLGRQDPVAGSVRILGLPALDTAAVLRRAVSSVLDEDAFFPTLTVHEHLTMVALGHGMPDPDAAVDSELEFFALTEAADRMPRALSSGQRRRLLLAAACLRPYRLLAVDEPEQRLDQGMRERLAERFAGVGTDDDGLLLVTHDPALLTACADRCLIVDGEVHEASVQEGARWIRERT
jgi:ABC-2 type transport system ATP-binding protein